MFYFFFTTLEKTPPPRIFDYEMQEFFRAAMIQQADPLRRKAIDAYKTKTNDLIFNLALPKITGQGSIKSNIGEIQNKGFELKLHSENIVKSDFEVLRKFFK